MKSSYDNRLLKRLAFLLAFLLILGVGYSSAQSKYVKKFRPLADSLSEEFGIPASVILGVAIIESGNGTSRNCKLLNNHFGIIGKNNVLATKGIRTRYKQYPSAQASYADFARLMTKKKFYARLKGNMNYHLWLDAISKAGYSTIPEEWKKRIAATIKKNKLSVLH